MVSEVSEVPAPESIRSRADARAADRIITYRIPADRARAVSAAQWARATWEDPPLVLRTFFVFGWRAVLGLKLGQLSSPRTVLGWHIIEDRPDTVTVEAKSRLITGQNIVTVHESEVLWTTLVRYEGRIGGLVWRTVELAHRVVLPYALSRAGGAHRPEVAPEGR